MQRHPDRQLFAPQRTEEIGTGGEGLAATDNQTEADAVKPIVFGAAESIVAENPQGQDPWRFAPGSGDHAHPAALEARIPALQSIGEIDADARRQSSAGGFPENRLTLGSRGEKGSGGGDFETKFVAVGVAFVQKLEGRLELNPGSLLGAQNGVVDQVSINRESQSFRSEGFRRFAESDVLQLDGVYLRHRDSFHFDAVQTNFQDRCQVRALVKGGLPRLFMPGSARVCPVVPECASQEGTRLQKRERLD